MRIHSFRYQAVLMFGLVLVACGPSAEELAPTLLAQTVAARETQTAAVGQALAAALTENAPSPTITFTPTESSTPTETATSTPTPNPLAVVVDASASVRSGPAIGGFDILVNAPQGTEIEIIGRNEAGDWLNVLLPDGEIGWMLARQVELTVEIEAIPVMITPTSAPDFILTIINNLSADFQIRIIELGNRHYVRPGESLVITLKPGTYTLTYRYGSDNCADVVFTINQNITFAPSSPETFCASFP